jgi:hypothetical protein
VTEARDPQLAATVYATSPARPAFHSSETLAANGALII